MKEKDILNEIKYLYVCERQNKDLEKREIKYLKEIERLNNIINELEKRYYSLDQNMGKSIIENDTREDFVKMEELFIKAKRCDKE